MEIFIFIFYLLLFSYFIPRISFFKNSGIGKSNIIILFVIKVFAGIAYAKFYTLPKYYNGSDTWRFYRLSLDETKWLLHNPFAFLKDLFVSGYSQRGNLFSGENTYWNDLKSNVIVKLMAVINVFTKSSYYPNIIFFNFLFLFGLVALFRLFYEIFPHKKLLIIAGLFLLPSTLFWCSGIHKDGLILSATGLIIYTFNQGLKEKFSVNRFLIILFCFLLVFSLRNYVLLALFPALLSWMVSEKYRGKGLIFFSLVYLLFLAVFLFITIVFPQVNFLSYLANKQHEFLRLEGTSKISLPLLQPTIRSFISFFPSALDMAFLRPHLSEIRNFIFIPAFIENLLLPFLFFISLLHYTKIQTKPLFLFLYFFSISIMLLSGYSIPFTGAIVRYKSFVLPLAITPLLCISSYPFERTIISNNTKKAKNYFKKLI